MGGKSEKERDPTPFERQQRGLALYGEEPISNSQSDADALGIFSALLSAIGSQAPIPPQLPTPPEVFREPEVNWKERQEQLASRARADYTKEKRRKKGRKSTISTSPLIEDEQVATTGSLVTGS